MQVFSQLCLERGEEILPPEPLGSASSSCELAAALLLWAERDSDAEIAARG